MIYYFCLFLVLDKQQPLTSLHSIYVLSTSGASESMKVDKVHLNIQKPGVFWGSLLTPRAKEAVGLAFHVYWTWAGLEHAFGSIYDDISVSESEATQQTYLK